MKRAQLKSMALEERYIQKEISFTLLHYSDIPKNAYFFMLLRFDELKKDGKLQKFLAKKRKHNASKDHKMMPMRRQKTE